MTGAKTPVRWRGYAFGLDLEGWPLPRPGEPGNGYFPAPTVCAPVGPEVARRTSIELVTTSALERAWRPREAVPVLERRFLDGSLLMAIDRHEELGYRIWVPRHGRYLISADGSRILASLPHRAAQWRWQRLLFAQTLPLAATLQGLELFHASAVSLGGRGLAFIAPAGTGKSSVAAHLVAGGASLVTDDVLALEALPTGIRAHPGAGMAAIDRDEWLRIPSDRSGRLGQAIGSLDKIFVAPRLAESAVPLKLLYFLERGERFRAFRLEKITPPDARLLLGSGFLPYVRSPERLVNHLDVCARIARAVTMMKVQVPASVAASEVAAHVEEHAHAFFDSEDER